MKYNSLTIIRFRLAGVLSVLLCGSALAAEDTSTVQLSVSSNYSVVAEGNANLRVGLANYNTIGEYNFVSVSGSPTYGTLAISVNQAWGIRAKLNTPMPTSPGGGYNLKVDDDRPSSGSSTGWSPALTTSDTELDFDGDGAAVNKTYHLDWRIEGLTEEDGVAPLENRIVTFTIYGNGIS